jgi:hypothetical protein
MPRRSPRYRENRVMARAKEFSATPPLEFVSREALLAIMHSPAP